MILCPPCHYCKLARPNAGPNTIVSLHFKVSLPDRGFWNHRGVWQAAPERDVWRDVCRECYEKNVYPDTEDGKKGLKCTITTWTNLVRKNRSMVTSTAIKSAQHTSQEIKASRRQDYLNNTKEIDQLHKHNKEFQAQIKKYVENNKQDPEVVAQQSASKFRVTMKMLQAAISQEADEQREFYNEWLDGIIKMNTKKMNDTCAISQDLVQNSLHWLPV